MTYEPIIIYTFLIIFGACIGSFLNVVISRLPFKGEFLSNKRSNCPECGNDIKPYDLIPILSWLLLKGRCRYCKARISIRYPLVEITCALLACAVVLKFGFQFSAIIVFGVTSILLAISIIDLKTTEIPDSLVIAVGVLAVADIFVFSQLGLIDRLIGLAAVSLPMLLLALAISGAFGGGDIKLMMACGFLLGWREILLAFFIAIILGGLYAIFLMISGRRKRGEHMVFGPALCAGVTVSLFYGYEIISWYLSTFMIY